MSTVVTTTPTIVELDDDQTSAFIEALERIGSVHGAARAIGVNRFSAYRRRYIDRDFRRKFDAARVHGRSRRLRACSDELMFSLDEIRHLLHHDWEKAVDELVNAAFGVNEPLLRREELDPEQLQAARDRLHAAGEAWARAVVQATDIATAKAADERRLLADALGTEGMS